MKFSLKNSSNIQLAKIFDFMAKMNNQQTAKIIVKRLAHRHHQSYEDQLRYLGKRAVRRNDYSSFNMVAKLWKDR